MQVELEVDGSRHVLEVDLEAGTVRVGALTLPLKVLSTDGERVELEVGGEKLVVDGWAPNNDRPTAPLQVNGEVTVLGALVRGAALRVATPTATTPSARATEPTPTSGTTGPGLAVLPPMPGKILEVRVSEGTHVEKGTVVVVLEAMKMRNEVASPASGTVRGLAAEVGSSVRAKDVLFRVVPD